MEGPPTKQIANFRKGRVLIRKKHGNWIRSLLILLMVILYMFECGTIVPGYPVPMYRYLDMRVPGYVCQDVAAASSWRIRGCFRISYY